MPTCGSLFSGIGLLDLGLHQAGWQHAWMCEADPWRRSILERRFGVPVYDDVRTVSAAADADGGQRPQEHQSNDGQHQQWPPQRRWPIQPAGAGGLATADSGRLPGAHATTGPTATGHPCPVDLIAGGFPCKGASSAGKREGFGHAETVLWHEMARIVRELRPRYVLIENVADILGMAASPMEPPGSLWGTVVGDLAACGYGDVRWECVPAAAVGAPHLRDRVFAVAVADPAGVGAGEPSNAAHSVTGSGHAWPEPLGGSGIAVADAECVGCNGWTSQCGERGTTAKRGEAGCHVGDSDSSSARGVAVDWGAYQPAISRWEAIHGPAPEPLVRRLDDGNSQLQRVRARMDRSRLSALGDAVHVYVARLVGTYVMDLERERLANLA